MSLQPPDFTTAAYGPTSPALADIPVSLPETAAPASPALLVRSIVCGFAGAVAGAVLYGGFVHLTHLNVGYLSVVIAYLIARAMMWGSGARGGRPFQVSAVLLTCLSVAMGNALMIYWSLRAEAPVPLTGWNVLQMLRFGAMEPFLEFQHSAAEALLTFFILFIGLRAAWRMTSGLPGAVRHPFQRGF